MGKRDLHFTTKGPERGPCNICDRADKLTWDHVPPRGSTRVTQITMNHLADLLGQGDAPPGLQSNNGQKFRTICADCNNRVLGGIYDPELAHLANQVVSIMSGKVHRPQQITVAMDPQYVTKAMVGHILAIGVERQEKGERGEQLAAYVLDPAAPLPRGVDVHLWVYPFRRQIAIRDAALMRNTGEFVVFWLLKFLPLACMLTFDESRLNPVPAPLITPYVRRPWKGRIQVPIQMTPLPAATFPEAPDSKGAVFIGEGAIASIPREPQPDQPPRRRRRPRRRGPR